MRRACAVELRPLWERAALGGHALELEATFPFCETKCGYCSLGTAAVGGRRSFGAWLDDLDAEAAFWSPPFRDHEFPFVRLGGGTSDLLSEEELARVVRRLKGSFRWSDGAAASVECHPASSDPEKLSALRRLGFNAAAFGVDTLSEPVLKAMGRRQTAQDVADAVAGARKAGFELVHLGLVLGLAGETLERFFAGFRTVAALGPDILTVCRLAPTQGYLRRIGAGRRQERGRIAGLLPEALERLAAEALAFGYNGRLDPEQGAWHLFSERLSPAWRAKVEERWKETKPFSSLALGPRGRSSLHGGPSYRRLPGRFDPEGSRYMIVTES